MRSGKRCVAGYQVSDTGQRAEVGRFSYATDDRRARRLLANQDRTTIIVIIDLHQITTNHHLLRELNK